MGFMEWVSGCVYFLWVYCVGLGCMSEDKVFKGGAAVFEVAEGVVAGGGGRE